MTTATGGSDILIDVTVGMCPSTPNKKLHWGARKREGLRVGNAIAAEIIMQGKWHDVHRLMLPKAYVLIERIYGSLNREWDEDNLVFAYKPIVDCLRCETPSELAIIQKSALSKRKAALPLRMGIFIADDPSSVSVTYRQVYKKGSITATRVAVSASPCDW